MLTLAVIPVNANEEQSVNSIQEQIDGESTTESSESNLYEEEELNSSSSEVELRSRGVISTVARILLYSKRLKFVLKNGDELEFEDSDPDKAVEAIMEYYVDNETFDQGDLRKNGKGKKVPKSDAIIRFYNVGNEQFHLAFGDVSMGMLHTVVRHFPEYWNGQLASGKSKNAFFNPDTEFSYVEEVIESISTYSTDDVDNEKEIENNIDNFKYVAYDGYHGDNVYRMVLSGDRVVTVFPLSYNQAKK
ncbi:hypothetical protein EN829_035265 [Mesorhizobium sp. M00.F.Ca.ET.186.01.1.1]|nr:hypothetical protein EN829_035265 [Mesorhizobium sp. M00.F.Ca.ET.186.01.1.1]